MQELLATYLDTSAVLALLFGEPGADTVLTADRDWLKADLSISTVSVLTAG